MNFQTKDCIYFFYVYQNIRIPLTQFFFFKSEFFFYFQIKLRLKTPKMWAQYKKIAIFSPTTFLLKISFLTKLKV